MLSRILLLGVENDRLHEIIKEQVKVITIKDKEKF